MNAPLSIPRPDRTAILAALSALFGLADVVELRAFHKGKKRTDAGYFDGEHRQELADAAVKLNAENAAVYVTLNQIDPQLLGRYCNRIQEFAAATTTDVNVLRRRWLLLDFDPVRPKDTSATDAQLLAAKARGRACYQFLRDQGWPEPLAGESGNGLHLVYPIDLPNDTPSRDLVKGALSGLAARLDDAIVTVDQSVFNAGRITKLFGTVATKGDHTPLTPWRLSRLVSTPARGVVVTPEQLRALHPVKSMTEQVAGFAGDSARRSEFDLLDFLSRLGIPYEQDMHEGRDRYKLEHCPFNPDHGKGEAAVFRAADGVLGFKCQHNSCADKHWQDVRALIDGSQETRRRHSHSGGAKAAVSKTSAGDTTQFVDTVKLIDGASVKPEAVNWLWNGYLARGKLHVLAGAPGTGKTMIALALAATVSSGGCWPDGTPYEAGNVLIWSAEDDIADTLVPRLIAMGADMTRIKFVGSKSTLEGREPFDPARDMPMLLPALADAGEIKLLIVDPIVSAVAGDSHKNAEVRRGLQPLVDVGQKLGAAVLGITHFSKGTAGREVTERVTGSLAFGALARVVLAAAKRSDDDGGGRIFARAKSNIGPDGGGFAYDLAPGTVDAHPEIAVHVLQWGAAIEGSARELLASAEDSGDSEERSAIEDAKEFLTGLLANGAIAALRVYVEGREAGFSERTLRRAQKALGVDAVKDGLKAGWSWRLPSKVAKFPEDGHTKSLDAFDKVGHLRPGPGSPAVVEVKI